jgi:transposase-like protein
MGYPKERKEAVLKKMLPPNNKTIPEISKEEGICEGTLYNWRKAARAEGRLMPDGDSTPSGWCASDKFAAVVETASMNKAELSAYCRKRGLYTEQISQWREACEQANDWDRNQNKRLKDIRKADEKRIKELERNLRRKEKALAETAALLVLRKKAQAIWGDGEEE